MKKSSVIRYCFFVIIIFAYAFCVFLLKGCKHANHCCSLFHQGKKTDEIQFCDLPITGEKVVYSVPIFLDAFDVLVFALFSSKDKNIIVAIENTQYHIQFLHHNKIYLQLILQYVITHKIICWPPTQ